MVVPGASHRVEDNILLAGLLVEFHTKIPDRSRLSLGYRLLRLPCGETGALCGGSDAIGSCMLGDCPGRKQLIGLHFST